MLEVAENLSFAVDPRRHVLKLAEHRFQRAHPAGRLGGELPCQLQRGILGLILVHAAREQSQLLRFLRRHGAAAEDQLLCTGEPDQRYQARDAEETGETGAGPRDGRAGDELSFRFVPATRRSQPPTSSAPAPTQLPTHTTIVGTGQASTAR